LFRRPCQGHSRPECESRQPETLDLRDSKILTAKRRHLRLRGVLLQDLHRDPRPVNTFTAHIHRQVFELPAARINVRSVAQPELEINRRGHPEDLRHFIVTNEPAKVVGNLNVQIDRNVDTLADRANLSRAEIARDIKRGYAAVLKELRRGRIGGGKSNRALDNQVLGQLTLLLHFVQNPDETQIGRQDAANTQVAGAPHVLNGIDKLVGAAMLQADNLSGRRGRLASRLKRGARPDEQADLDFLVRFDARHLRNFLLGQQHDAASLAHTVDRHLPLFRGCEHLTKDSRPFDAWDLKAILPPVGKAQFTGLEFVIVFRGQLEFREKLLSFFHESLHIPMPKTLGLRPSASGSRPLANIYKVYFKYTVLVSA